MAIFTDTPIVIRATSPWFWLHDYGGVSEFAYGGGRYVCGMTQDFTSAVIGKTTDGGLTWTVFVGAETGFAADFLEMVLDESTETIVFMGVKTGQLATFAFDLNTETYSTATLAGAGTSGGYIVRRPNGEIFAFYSPSPAPKPIYYRQIVAGAFGAQQTLLPVGAINLAIRGVQSDAAGNIHALYNRSGEIWYVQLSAAGVVGTPVAVDVNDGPLLSNIVIDTSLDQIFCQGVFRTVNYAYIGSPVSNPSWTVQALHAGGDGLDDQEGCVVQDGSTVKFMFLRTDFAGQTEVAQVEWNGSTLGARDVWWDLIANRTPGTESVPADDIFTDGITALSAGGLLSVVVTAVIDTALEMSNVYTYGASGPVERLRGRFY